MIKFPCDIEHSYILILTPLRRTVLSTVHRHMLNANSVYKIISYIPFKWVCVKHRVDSPSNVMHTDIKDLIGGILLDTCTFELNATFEEIHLKLIEHFNYAGQCTLSKLLCIKIDEDFYDFTTNHIDDKKYFFPI